MSEGTKKQNRVKEMDYLKVNQKRWNKFSQNRGPWSRRYPKERIEKAKSGLAEFSVTPGKFIPADWLPKNWKGLDVLGLAAGGGQQMPLIAAAGAKVISFDFSEEQLRRDLEVCEEEGITIQTRQGEMENLNDFSDESFDFVINPVSTCYTKDVRQVWREVHRVLRPGGVFIAGFNNPVAYALDTGAYDKDKMLKLTRPIPWSDADHLSEEEINRIIQRGEALEFGHSLSDLIGGQIEVGFAITGFYESYWGSEHRLLDSILPQFIATRAVKVRG